MAGEFLLAALAELDRLSTLGGGNLAIVPRNVQGIGQGDYNGWRYVAWPKPQFDTLVNEWLALGFFGDNPFAGNFEVAKLIDQNAPSFQMLVAKQTASTVNDLRSKLRNALPRAGIVPPKPPGLTVKSFPWAWVLGTVALGLGLGFVLYVAETQHALPRGDAA